MYKSEIGIFQVNIQYIEKISYSCICMKLTNLDDLVTREVMSGRRTIALQGVRNVSLLEILQMDDSL